ncbi:MAG: hypothetical protein LAQ30_19140 [Acidobacteriia bacterium]|nr:hypothetical protein [Terriglobia bacterium]
MSRNFLIAFVIGLVCIAIAVAGILYMQRGAHLDLPGQVLKVRTAPLDENSSVAMIDFRISNTSDYPAVVRTVMVYAEEKNGNRLAGETISDPDAKRVFDAIPLLGAKYNQSLILRDRLPPHAVWDRMIGARFDVPDAKLGDRKRFLITIEEVDGKVFEISEK